ncbi:MAG: 50S ribosomal protein L5 [Solirubrobacterales bacterium]|nr:50S ribosomal protein L5 [Solirubrobacterales bacterium]MCB8916033.1 50S ribosomal protein L5 [Thermoleophilales bacterium]
MEAATTTQQAVPPPRLRETYNDEVLPKLMQTFGYSTPMRAPRLEKITLNMGLGSSVDSKSREKAIGELALIAGQMPNTRIAKKSIASFKLREGMPVGASVTLRGARMWEFLDRLCSIAIPRIRDFRGLKATSFDGRGNYSMGVREQLIFPEIDYDTVDETRGLDITITTSAPTDYEAFELLLGLGMPFAKEGRPVPEGAEESTEEATAEEAAAEEAPAEAEAAEEAPAEEAEADAADDETETQEDQA